MNTKGNTILITGGATGIGFALAQQFLKAGNEVIVCGRRKEKLKEAKAKLPALYTKVCDVRNESDRMKLINEVIRDYPGFNMLINNAGIQHLYDLQKFIETEKIRNEMTTNFLAPAHLTGLVAELFKK